MEEGKDYFITNDPQGQGQDDWSVIYSGSWDKVVGRYKDIELNGDKMSFRWEPQYVPEGIDINTSEFEVVLGTVLNEILKDHHEKGAMIYVNKETGETVDY